MFNDKYGLTKAVLEGKKIQTRRIVPESWLKDIEKFQEDYFNDTLDHLEGKILMEQYFLVEQRRHPHYAVGETVAIAQSLKELGYNPSDRTNGAVWGLDHKPEWTNKMFVGASQCKNQIHITGIRLERLQDISDDDCLKEGIIEDYPGVQYSFPTEIGYCGQYPFSTPRAAYAALIDKISGKGTWEKNPWVFVYDFELVK